MWSWQVLVQPRTCRVYMRHSLEYQSLLCCFYTLWFPIPFLCHPHSTGHSRVSKELHFFIESFPFPHVIKPNENLIPFSTVLHTSILMTSDPSPMDALLQLVLTTLPCTARIKSFHHVSWSLKEQTLYGTCICTFGIYLEILELVLMKDVQNSLESFGVWNQYIARNSVQINKWNGNKPYLGTERNHHPPSVLPA